jgi:hypothetical protein
VSTLNSISTSDRASSLTREQKRRIGSWVTALRSGRYSQAIGKLKDHSGYCCLGVACDVFRKAKKRQGEAHGWDYGKGDDSYSFLGELGEMPTDVAEWFGLATDPKIIVGSMGEILATTANDDMGYSLKKIGALVKRTYLKKARGRIR